MSHALLVKFKSLNRLKMPFPVSMQKNGKLQQMQNSRHSRRMMCGNWSNHAPPGRNVVGSKWVFKVKYKNDGRVDRFKARLYSGYNYYKGYSQKLSLDYDETFSPVVSYSGICSSYRMTCSSIKWTWLLPSLMETWMKKNFFVSARWLH